MPVLAACWSIVEIDGQYDVSAGFLLASHDRTFSCPFVSTSPAVQVVGLAAAHHGSSGWRWPAFEQLGGNAGMWRG